MAEEQIDESTAEVPQELLRGPRPPAQPRPGVSGCQSRDIVDIAGAPPCQDEAPEPGQEGLTAKVRTLAPQLHRSAVVASGMMLLVLLVVLETPMCRSFRCDSALMCRRHRCAVRMNACHFSACCTCQIVRYRSSSSLHTAITGSSRCSLLHVVQIARRKLSTHPNSIYNAARR